MWKDKKTWQITLAGEGGQGLQAIGDILARCAIDEGYFATYIPNYGVEMRGGVSIAFVVISDKPIASPRFDESDLIICLSERSVERVEPYMTEESLLVYDSSLFDKPVTKTRFVVGVPATEIARKNLTSRTFNMLIMGFVIGLSGIITIEHIDSALKKQFEKYYEKDPALHELNMKAIRMGIEEANKIKLEEVLA